MIESAGSFAIGTQILYLTMVTAASYGLVFGLKQGQKSVLSLGMCTGNIGAELATLYAT
jgi:BASS family bile acid:Na+ symporter